MLQFIEQGDMFADKPDILVCHTNCRGVMGAGLAKVFYRKYPAASKRYSARCENWTVNPGDLIAYDEGGKTIWFIPTKNDWRNESEIEWIKTAVTNIQKEFARILATQKEPIVIHIPALGAGLGGLEWSAVKAIFETEFEVWKDNAVLNIKIFAPK